MVLRASELKAAADKLFHDLNEYTRSQKYLWQRIPWLALEAVGRGEFMTVEEAYKLGKWPVKIGLNNVAWVDLETGELVLSCFGNQAPNKEGLVQILYHLELVDAREITADLSRWVAKPYRNDQDEMFYPSWKEDVRRSYHVEQVYVRLKAQFHRSEGVDFTPGIQNAVDDCYEGS